MVLFTQKLDCHCFCNAFTAIPFFAVKTRDGSVEPLAKVELAVRCPATATRIARTYRERPMQLASRPQASRPYSASKASYVFEIHDNLVSYSSSDGSDTSPHTSWGDDDLLLPGYTRPAQHNLHILCTRTIPAPSPPSTVLTQSSHSPLHDRVNIHTR